MAGLTNIPFSIQRDLDDLSEHQRRALRAETGESLAQDRQQYALLVYHKEQIEIHGYWDREHLNEFLLKRDPWKHAVLRQAVPLPTLLNNTVADPLAQLPQPREGDFSVVRMTEVPVRPVQVAWALDDEKAE